MKESVDRTFEVMGLMEELRDIWRESAPLHRLSDDERKRAISIIQRAIELLKEIEGTL
jgi:flagellin-specific chaperone FliS